MLTKTILVVLLFGLASSHDILSRSHHFPGKQLIFGEDSFENTTLSYATCDISKNSTEKKCTVVREVNVLEGTSRTISCELTLKTVIPESVIGSSLKIVPLGINRTIVIWTESHEKVTIVRYTTVTDPECKTTEAKLTFLRKDEKFNFELVRIAKYNDSSYCLAFFNDTLCGEKALCKLHVDPVTNKTHDVKKWFTPEADVNAVVSVVNEGHLIVEGSLTNVPQAYIVKTDGKIVKFPSEIDSQRSWKLVYSTTYSTIGLCYYSNSSFNCAQYSHDGQPKLRSNPEFDFKVEQSAMYNLKDTGFLLLTSRCESICSLKDDHYYITKFDGEGRKVGEVRVTGFHREALTNLVKAQFFEKETGIYCLSFVRYDISMVKDSAGMLLFAKCFDDKSFK